MVIARQRTPFTCAGCLCRQSVRLPRRLKYGRSWRAFSQTAALPQQNAQASAKHEDHSESSEEKNGQEKEQGGMSRRLAQMTDESIEQGGRNAMKALEEGAFSEELKRRLEARIQDSSFKSQNPAVFAQLDLPVRPEPSRNSCYIIDAPTVQRRKRYA